MRKNEFWTAGETNRTTNIGTDQYSLLSAPVLWSRKDSGGVGERNIDVKEFDVPRKQSDGGYNAT